MFFGQLSLVETRREHAMQKGCPAALKWKLTAENERASLFVLSSPNLNLCVKLLSFAGLSHSFGLGADLENLSYENDSIQ